MIFWIEGHNSNVWKSKKGACTVQTCACMLSMHANMLHLWDRAAAGISDRIVMDAPFLRMHWYKLLAWYTVRTVQGVAAACMMPDDLSKQPC